MPRTQAESKKDLLLGYLYILLLSDKDIYSGAVMITDIRGIPIDFKYVDPIKLTRLEKVLYGDALDAYLKEELILHNLLKSLEKKPHVLICQDPSLVKPSRSLLKSPVLHLEPHSGAPLESAGMFEKLSEGECYLLQVEEVGPPLKAYFGVVPEESEVKSLSFMLTEASRNMDLLEPFQRIAKALDVIIEEGHGKP